MDDNNLTLSSLCKIDWEKVYRLPWHLDIDEPASEKHEAVYWNERAKTMYDDEDYCAPRVKAFLEFVDIPAGASVIDIASGIGVLTLPLIEKGCRVTAVDISDYSLDVLKKNCVKNIENLRIVNEYFREAAENLEPCDYVLNFYSLGLVCMDRGGNTDLADLLIKMNNLAKKKVVITMPENEENDIAEVFKKSYYWILYGVLLSLGIVPKLEFKWVEDLGMMGIIHREPIRIINKK